MPTTIDMQCQQMRGEIARSRRRLDRTAQRLAGLPRRGSWLPQLVAAGSSRWAMTLTVVGLAVSQWPRVHRWLRDHRPGGASMSVPGILGRWARQLRVLAWRDRRRQRSAHQGAPSQGAPS